MENDQKRTDLLKGTVEYRIKVEVPIDSEAYQAFLNANKRREQAREETGGPDLEAEAGYLKAVKNVSEFAIKLIAGDRRLI